MLSARMPLTHPIPAQCEAEASPAQDINQFVDSYLSYFVIVLTIILLIWIANRLYVNYRNGSWQGGLSKSRQRRALRKACQDACDFEKERAKTAEGREKAVAAHGKCKAAQNAQPFQVQRHRAGDCTCAASAFVNFRQASREV